MKLTILQFLVRIITRTATGLVMILRRGIKDSPARMTHSPRRPLPIATRQRGNARRTRTRRMKAKPSSKLRLRTRTFPLSLTEIAKPVAEAKPDVIVSACPTCRLEAPEALMAEHFLGSPSHQFGTPQALPGTFSEAAPEASPIVGSEEDPNSLLRNLLQMLVPPRAFGHRQQQRTFNPLSKLVQSLEAAQSALVQPLKGS